MLRHHPRGVLGAVVLGLACLSLLSPAPARGQESPAKRALAIREDIQAGLLQERGDYAAARPLCERALAIRERALDPEHPDIAFSLYNLAELLATQGDYAAARPLYERALAIYKKVLGPEHPNTVAALSELGWLLQEQGDYAAARPHYERVLAIREKVLGKEHPDTARSLNNLAMVLGGQGDYAAAQLLCERALAIRKKVLRPEHPETVISLNNLAWLLTKQGDYTAAQSLCERALAIREKVLRPEHPDTARSLDNLAMVLGGQGDYAAALPLHKRALAIREKVLGPKHPETAISLGNLAALLYGQGNYAAAEPLLRRALEIDRENLELAAAAQAERQQLAMGQSLRNDLNGYLSLASAARLPADAAYRHVLAWKGAVLQRQRRMHALRRLAREDHQPEVARLAGDLQDTATRLATLALAVPDPQRRDAWQRQIADLTERKEHLEAELARRSAAFRRERAQQATTPGQLQAALPPGTALVDLLEYTHNEPPAEGKGRWRTEARLVAFVVRPDRPIVRLDLGPVAPIAAAVDRWRATYGGLTPRRDDSAATLRQWLWAPLELYLEGMPTVLVSPDGDLARLPLAALPGKEPGAYLLEERAIALLPVPQLLPELMKPADDRPGSTEGLLAVGDVNYGADPGSANPTGISRSATADAGARLQFGPLAATGLEIAAVGALFARRHPDAPVLELKGDRATEEALRRQAGRHRWLHLATHGFFNPPTLRPALGPPAAGAGADPFGGQGVVGFHPGLLSGLALTGANRLPKPGKDDGILTALEVAALDLDGVEVVALSACETGLGQTAGGEGLLGLQRAFQEAGTQSVVATLWKVHDTATRVLMERFYVNLWQKKMGKLEALREAQLWMLSEGQQWRPTMMEDRGLVPLDEPQFSDKPGRLRPFFWAAFVLSGDWR